METNMNITIKVSDLRSAAKAVKPAVPVKGHSIVNGVLLVTAGGTAELFATNLEMAIRWPLSDVQVSGDGRALIPAYILYELLPTLASDAELEISVTSEKGTLSCSGTQSKFDTGDVENFPAFPQYGVDFQFAVDGGGLADAISFVRHAASTFEDGRLFTQGIQLLVDGSQVTLTALDGYRMATTQMTIAVENALQADAIVPVKQLTALGATGFFEDQVVIEGDANVLSFATKKGKAAISRIATQYPQWEEVIPREERRAEVSMNVADLMRCVRQAHIFSREDNQGIKLGLESQILTTEAVSVELGMTQDATAHQGLKGEEVSLLIKSNFLLDALGALGGEVSMRVFEGDSPLMLLPANENGHGRRLCLVMPLKDKQ